MSVFCVLWCFSFYYVHQSKWRVCYLLKNPSIYLSSQLLICLSLILNSVPVRILPQSFCQCQIIMLGDRRSGLFQICPGVICGKWQPINSCLFHRPRVTLKGRTWRSNFCVFLGNRYVTIKEAAIKFLQGDQTTHEENMYRSTAPTVLAWRIFRVTLTEHDVTFLSSSLYAIVVWTQLPIDQGNDIALSRPEMRTVRWMCCVKSTDKLPHLELSCERG